MVMRSSRGCREVIQVGRKSQFCSLIGKLFGLRACRMFTVATNIIIMTAGEQTPVITFQPAMERAKTREGSSTKQRIR